MSIPDTPTLLLDGLIKYDTDTGAVESHDFGPGRYGSEAVFAPRSNGAADHAGSAGDEDDGYVVSFVTDMNADRSECVVLDARDLAAGPVARILLPHRISSGTHSCWADAREIDPTQGPSA